MKKKKFYSSGINGMPDKVIMKEYPKVAFGTYSYDDTLSGIDSQINSDIKKAMRQKSNKRY